MAYAHEIKFFIKDSTLYAALYDHPPLFCNEFWIKNVNAGDLSIQVLPNNVELERKYRVRDLGIEPFYASKPVFKFMDKVAEIAWRTGKKLAIGTFLK